MQAVILAAGEGTRLRPFTVSEPKVMIQVANKPILEYVIEALAANKIRDIVLIVGYKKERIMSYFEDGKKFNVKIEYAVEDKQLGTAHALSTAQALVRIKKSGETKEKFLVLAGDNIIDRKTISNILRQKPPTALLVQRSQTSKYGVALMEKDIITNIIEKPEQQISNLVCTGIYLFDETVFDDIHALARAGKHDLPSVLQIILTKQRMHGIITDGTWMDAVYPWDLLTVNATALSRIGISTSGTVERNVFLRGAVKIGCETIIRSGCYILGPVVIGSGCELGPNVCIYPSTSIGNNVQIKPFTIVENSIVMNDVVIGPNSYLSHSIIGEGSILGAHCSASSGKATVSVEKEYHELTYIGALIGEDTRIEDNVVIQPGTIIGTNCRISGQKIISKSLPNHSIVA